MDYAQVIKAQALQGTPNNPGVPSLFADLLVAQSKHETNDYTSRFFINYNNAFGYSYYSGSQYQIGAGDLADNDAPVAVYPSVQASTMEMVDWVYRRVHSGVFPALSAITTPEDYATLLKQANYYGDTLANYLAGLKRWFAPVVVSAGVILLIAILFVLFNKQILNYGGLLL